MLRDFYSKAVTRHAGDRPLFYNLADEIGFGDQSGANDFCWDYPSRDYFRDTLIQMYGTIEKLNSEWGTNYPSWAAVRSVQPTTYWQYDRLHRDIYLPRDFQVANSDQAMRTFGTVFRSFADMVNLYADLRTSEPVDVAYVQKQCRQRRRQGHPQGNGSDQREVRQRVREHEGSSGSTRPTTSGHSA